jgi:hypothetical protein
MVCLKVSSQKCHGNSEKNIKLQWISHFENVQFQQSQISNLSVKLPPFKIFLSLVFKFTAPKKKKKLKGHSSNCAAAYNVELRQLSLFHGTISHVLRH